MNKDEELLPCPCCGSTDVGVDSGMVSCYVCNLSMDRLHVESAIKAWNTRSQRTEQAKEMDGWIADRLPELELGGELHCFIAVRNKKTQKVHVWDGYYCNKPVPEDAEGYDYDWVLHDLDGEALALVGWAERMNHPDFSVYYEPLRFNYSDFLAWMPVNYPKYPLSAAPAPDTSNEI